MKKKTLFLILFSISIALIYHFSTQESEIEKQRKQYADFLKNHPYNKTLALSKKERKKIRISPNKYFEQEYLLEMSPSTGRTHPENYLKAQQNLQKHRSTQRTPGDGTDNPWIERGPNNVGGRTRVVIYDPNDSTHKRVFAGGVSGGLWVNNDITDENSSWARIGIPENLSVSCITVDPNNSQIFYLGTGESYTGDQGVGNGVWKSTDGGSTWANVYRDDFNEDLDQRLYYINDIKARNNPITNKTEIYFGAAGARYGESGQFLSYYKAGLYKSTDNGNNWNKIELPIIPNASATSLNEFDVNDIEIGADNTIWIGTTNNISGEGGGTILKSTDGSSFSIVHTIIDGLRTEIAVSSTNKDKIFILNNSDDIPLMFVTTDGFSNTASITLPIDADTEIPNNDFTREQAFYNLVIEVDPSNDNIVYVGGINLFRSTDNGGNWSQISKSSDIDDLIAPFIHPDQHALTFHPTDRNIALIGNDGGVFYASSLSDTSGNATTINSRNKNYNITQFYNGAIGQNENIDLLLAGSQDNGTQFIDNATSGINASIEVYGGDGAHSFIDKDGEYIIVSYVNNVKSKFDLPDIDNEVIIIDDEGTGDFINSSELDDNLDILYTNGSTDSDKEIFKFTEIITEDPIKTELKNTTFLDESPSVLKISPYTTSTSKLYAGLRNGKLLKIENANDTNSSNHIWSDISGDYFLGSISSIEFGANENEILVTFHNYDTISIWYTEDGGATWLNKEGNFPDIPVKAILMNPLNNNEVIIGTQLGIWKTNNFKDTSPSWTQSDNGMSNVKITSLELRTTDNTVLASTFGRGMFTGKFTEATASTDTFVTNKNSFSIYPTVSDGDFTIHTKNTLGETQIDIFDINGKQVYEKQINFTANQKHQISTNLTAGIYIINLIDINKNKLSNKIVIR